MSVFGAIFGCRGDGGFSGALLGVSSGGVGFSGPLLGVSSGGVGFSVARSLCPVRELALRGLDAGVSAKQFAQRTKNR